jgi:hypothetical protein
VSGEAVPAPARAADYALSVLLHDIGKFWERSSDAPRPSPAELALYCPRLGESGGYGHQHAALSARFIDEVVRIDGASRWGPRHHLPDLASREELCAHLGDWLAGGELGADESRDAPGASSTPLRAVLSGLVLDGPAPEPRFLGLERLDNLSKSLAALPAAPVSREDYRFHWNHFLNAIDKLGSPISDLETWMALLEVFTSRIPAASTNRQLRSIPDIDLYTHSRLVAALAVALWKGPMGLPELVALRTRLHAPVLEKGEKAEAPLCTLILAEVAGAARFRSASRRPAAGNATRGRALLVDLLAEEAARRFARHLGLSLASILDLKGPRFLLLAPPGSKWEEMRDELAARLAGEARGELGLAAAAVDLTLTELRTGMARAFTGLDAGLEEALASRLSRLARSSYDRAFGFIDRDGLPECADCGGAADETPPAAGEGGPPPAEPLCALCASLDELGTRWGEARFLLRRPEGAGERGYRQLLAAVGSSAWDAVSAEGLAGLAGGGGLEGIYSLGRLDLEELAKVRPLGARTLGFRWSRGGGRGALESRGQACLAAGVNGLERLLVLGVPPGGAALARILALSEASRLFFTGWAAAEIERGFTGSLVLLGSGRGEVLAGGAFPHALGFLAQLAPGFATLWPHPALSFSAAIEADEDFGGTLVSRAGKSLEAARRRLSSREAAGPAPAAIADPGAAALAPSRAGSRASLAFLGEDLSLEDLAELGEVVGWIAARTPGDWSARRVLRVLRGAEEARRREWDALRAREPGLADDQVREAISWKRWRWRLAAGLPLERLREWLLEEREPAGAPAGARGTNIERLPLVLRWVELLGTDGNGERS